MADSSRKMGTPVADVSSAANDHLDSVVAIHAENVGKASKHQKIVEKLTIKMGQPYLFYITVAISGLWLAVNTFGVLYGFRSWDASPFPLLSLVSSLGGFLVAIVVLITQNRQSKFNQHQAQLDLQISLLIDQRTAKIVQLIEELRVDMPTVRNRVDHEAEMLGETVDALNLSEDLERKIGEAEALNENTTPQSD